ncbi:hypothetical protein [Prosthecobacter sp.]|uniref:hypothetical protein n=1 Tax=Prosthecobacter sp. TaxID=1965333 RepID=UPI0037843912
MKPHLCLFLACFSLLAAQEPPKDPFVKDKKAEIERESEEIIETVRGVGCRWRGQG